MENECFIGEKSKDWALEGVRQLMRGNIRISHLYFSIIDPIYFTELLQSLTNSQFPPTNIPSYMHPAKFRWFCHCFASSYNIENNFNSFVLTKARFTSSDLQTVHDIRSYLRNPNIKADDDLKFKLAISFINLIKESRPLSIWLLPIIQPLYETFSTNQLYSQLKFCMFCFFQDIGHFSESDISQIEFEYNDIQPYEYLFQIPQVYSNTKLLNIIERNVFTKYKFPIPTNFAKSNLYVSLINTSFSTNVHFIDSFEKHITDLYNSGDFQNFKKFTAIFGSFQPWFFASVFRDKCPTLPYYFEKPEFKYENISTEFLNRLYNDRQLFQTVRELTGTTNSCIEFLNHSVPYLFFHSIRINISIFWEPLQLLQKIKFYIISDEDKVIDFDFCYSYFVLYRVMEFFAIKDDTVIDNEVFVQIPLFIKAIESIEKKNSLYRDLLSLIFIQNKEGQFICHFNVGFMIIKILLELNEDQSFMPFIKSSYQRFNLVYCLNLSHTIENAIFPNKYQLLDALLKSDTDIANYLARLSDSNEQLYNLSMNVKKYMQKEPFNILQSDEPTIKEIALSFDDKTALRYALNFETDDVEHQVFEKRSNDKKVLLEFPKYQEIMRQLSDLDTNKWQTYEIKENLPLFGSFYNMLNSFVPISLHIKFAETVKDVLLLNPRKTIATLLESNQFDESKEVAKKLKIDIFSMVFSNDFSEKVLFHFSEDFPAITYAHIISNNKYLQSKNQKFINKNMKKILYEGQNKIENKRIQFIRNNLMNMKQKNNFSNDSEIKFSSFDEKVDFYDNLNQNGITTDHLIDSIDDLFEIYPSKKESLIDIRYRVDEKLFKERILKHLNNENLLKIRNLFDDCLFETDEYDFLLNLKVKPFPFESSFFELINNNEIEKARKMYDLFKDSSPEFENIINKLEKEIIQNHKNIGQIMTQFPFIKERIISSFSFQQVKEFDTEFQDFLESIPDDWDMNALPNEIVANHIDEYDTICYLLSKFKFLNVDDSIIQFVDLNITQNRSLTEVVKILQLADMIEVYSKCIRNTAKYVDFILERICLILYSFETSIENEQIFQIALMRKTIVTLRINDYINTNHKSTLNKIECLYQILLRQFYTKFNQKESFCGFNQIEFGEKFANLSLKYDDVELLKIVCNAWDLDFYSYLDKKIIFSYQLSIYDCDFDLSYLNIKSEIQKKSRCKLSDEIVKILSHLSFYDSDFIQNISQISLPIENLLDFLSYSLKDKTQVRQKPRSKTTAFNSKKSFRRYTTTKLSHKKNSDKNNNNESNENENEFALNFYHRIQNLIQNKSLPTKAQKTQLDYFLNEVAPPSKAISYYVSDCKLNKAIQFLNDIEDDSEKEELFSDSLFKAAVDFDEVGRLRNSMKVVPEYSKSYLNSLLEVSTKMNLLNLKLVITQFLNLHDAAAETAIDLYKGQFSNYQNLSFLDIAQIEIALELRIRKQEKKENCILSTEKLNDLMKIIDLQRKYNVFICEKQLHNSCFSVFSNKVNQEAMVILLFKEKYFELGFEFVFEFQIPMRTIGERIIDILITDSDQALVNYISDFESNCSQNFFKEIIYSMINRIVFVLGKLNIASLIIHKAISDKLFKCFLMVQFNMIEDAAEIAFKNNFDDLVPVIANQAYLLLKKEVVQKCQKYLENKSS